MPHFSPDQTRTAAAAPPVPAEGLHDDWWHMPMAEIIRHVLARYHERHRAQLPDLIYLARKVERVHATSPACPAGLADCLESVLQELDSHMSKEEQILFPLLLRGEYRQAQGPIAVMRFEHRQHDEALQDVLALTNQITLPDHACATWRALYAGLAEFRNDLMQHIHLENNVLFLKATNAIEGVHHG